MRYNKTHYDTVSDAWTYVMGDNLHYGYFDPPELDLKGATDKLIDSLASLSSIDANTSILDVGCGIGNPAFHLHRRFGCRVTGITVSSRGVEIAQERSEQNGTSGSVQFLVADAMDNGLPDNTFDIAWVMESSHLMRDKERLFEECFRVLKNNGCLLLCDLTLIEEFGIAEVFKYKEELAILERSFGKAKMETLSFYERKLAEQGFKDVEVVDISAKVTRTLTEWKENTTTNKDQILRFLDEEGIDGFLRSCDILSAFFADRVLGYGQAKGVKRV